MDTFQQSATPHEYRVKPWLRVLYIVIAIAIAAGETLAALNLASDSIRPIALLFALFPAAICIYLVVLAFRSRVILDGSRIEVRNAFRDRSADLSEIEGYRTVSTRNGTYTQFYLKGGRGSFNMSNSFSTDDGYRAWFQQLTDLDKCDRETILNEISQHQDLGATPEERLANLSSAKTLSIFLAVAAVAAALALNLGEPVLKIPSAFALALAPLAVAYLLHRSPLLYSILKKKSDPRAELFFAVMAAAFGFLIRMRGVDLVSAQPLFLLTAVLLIAFFAVFYRSITAGPSLIGSLIAMLFFGGMYSYGLVFVANSLDDKSPTRTYIVPITGKHTTSGKSTSYYLELASWGPVDHPNNLSVSSASYDQFNPGDQICIGLHSGRLHAAWYAPIECSNGSSNDTTP